MQRCVKDRQSLAGGLVVALLLLNCSSAGAALAAPSGSTTAPDAAAGPAENLDARVARLIEQLGASNFDDRERAQAELSRLGLDTFDALIEAQKSDDIEIQLRAKYLVRSMSVRWSAEGDSPEVVRVLKGYGDQNETERRTSLDQLGRLAERAGLIPLCRLTRFEINPELSKRAALFAIAQTEPTDAAERQRQAKTIVEAVGSSKRPAAQWLRTYAKTLENPEATLAEWDALVRNEQEVLAQQPDQTSREIVRDLFRWQVTLLQKLKRDDEAVAVIRRTINLLDGTPQQIIEVVDWLVEREAWLAVQEVADRFPDVFNDSPLLLYRLAETQLKLDKADLAKQTAARALTVHPENLDAHFLVAFRLQEKGLFEWSELEYRLVISHAPVGSVADFKVRFLLSEMLHDLAREGDAADVLQPLADLMDKDEAAKAQAVNADRDPEAIYARVNFFRAQHLAEQMKAKESLEHLHKALEYDATDADVLIALYRLPGQSEAAKAEVKAKIESAAKVYRDEIEEFSDDAEQAANEAQRALFNAQVATSCNQFAWLVGNTFGDFDEAVRASHRSIELRPKNNAGYLDTLGRCYFAKGDLASAVKYQSQAAKLDPHSRAIQRQLAQFEKEWKAQNPGKPAPDADTNAGEKKPEQQPPKTEQP